MEGEEERGGGLGVVVCRNVDEVAANEAVSGGIGYSLTASACGLAGGQSKTAARNDARA